MIVHILNDSFFFSIKNQSIDLVKTSATTGYIDRYIFEIHTLIVYRSKQIVILTLQRFKSALHVAHFHPVSRMK